MRFCFASPKGGVGKTTAAVIIASEAVRHGQTVTIIETDPNGHLRDWYAKGNCSDKVQFVFDDDPSGAKLVDAIETASEQSDIVIIDTEGTANRRADIACQSADLVAIPLQFSDLDLKGALAAHTAIMQMEQLTGTIIPKILIPNKLSSAIISKDERNIREAILQTDMALCDPGILEKAAFRLMMATGCLLHDLPTHTTVNNIQPAFDNAQAVLRSMINHFRNSLEQGQ